jgi:hypothetical protein
MLFLDFTSDNAPVPNMETNLILFAGLYKPHELEPLNFMCLQSGSLRLF